MALVRGETDHERFSLTLQEKVDELADRLLALERRAQSSESPDAPDARLSLTPRKAHSAVLEVPGGVTALDATRLLVRLGELVPVAAACLFANNHVEGQFGVLTRHFTYLPLDRVAPAVLAAADEALGAHAVTACRCYPYEVSAGSSVGRPVMAHAEWSSDGGLKSAEVPPPEPEPVPEPESVPAEPEPRASRAWCCVM
jgi:hypothetical protein